MAAASDGTTPHAVADLRFSLSVFGVLAAVVILAGAASELLPAGLAGPKTLYIASLQPHWIDRFFDWDALWYERIAVDGYGWQPADAGHEQTVAFFPLWPLLMMAVRTPGLSPEAARWVEASIAALIAFASVHAFQRLALRLLAPAPARLATWFYALWPAALFLLQSYPTGLINLLAILGLEFLLRGRIFAAALVSGVATACGPLAIGLAGTVGFAAVLGAREAARPYRGASAARVFLGDLARALPVAALSAGGLILFMIWQAVRFGDPLAFVEAQRAWGGTAGGHVLRFLAMGLVLPEMTAAAASLAAGIAQAHQHLYLLQYQVENAINLLGLATALLLLPAVWRLRAAPVACHATLTLALYLWFIAADHSGWATLRLIYPAVGLFLALGRLLHARPRTAAATLGVSALLLALHAFLMNAGYGVI